MTQSKPNRLSLRFLKRSESLFGLLCVIKS